MEARPERRVVEARGLPRERVSRAALPEPGAADGLSGGGAGRGGEEEEDGELPPLSDQEEEEQWEEVPPLVSIEPQPVPDPTPTQPVACAPQLAAAEEEPSHGESEVEGSDVESARCVANAVHESRTRTCPRGHALALAERLAREGGRPTFVQVCDGCEDPIEAAFTHRCEACDYDLCHGCYTSLPIRSDIGLPTASFEVGMVCETAESLLMRRGEDMASLQVATVPVDSRVQILEVGAGPTGRRVMVRDQDRQRGWVSVVNASGKELLRALPREVVLEQAAAHIQRQQLQQEAAVLLTAPELREVDELEEMGFDYGAVLEAYWSSGRVQETALSLLMHGPRRGIEADSAEAGTPGSPDAAPAPRTSLSAEECEVVQRLADCGFKKEIALRAFLAAGRDAELAAINLLGAG